MRICSIGIVEERDATGDAIKHNSRVDKIYSPTLKLISPQLALFILLPDGTDANWRSAETVFK